MQSRTPFSTEGMKLRGTAPPKTSSTNSNPPPRAAVLAAPAGLLLVLALALGAPLHRLLVGDARGQEVHLHVVFPLHALDDHLDVQASDSRDQELLRLGVEVVV